MKFLLAFTVVKRGFFGDTTYRRTEIIESDSLITAYEEQIQKAERYTLMSDGELLFSVEKIETL